MSGLLLLLLIALVLSLLLLGLMITWDTMHPPRRTAGWALGRGIDVDPADMGLSFEEWDLRVSDGSTVKAWDVMTGMSSPGPVVVLLHGWSRSRIDMLPVLETWSRLVPRVIIMDLRGHGDAGSRTCRLGQREVEDVLQLLQAIGTDTILVGHSLGATVAIMTAASGRSGAEHVRGVLAIAPYEGFDVPIAAKLRARRIHPWLIMPVVMSIFRCLGIVRRSTSTHAGRLECPLLVLQGAKDMVSPPEQSRMIADAGGGTYMQVDGGFHDQLWMVDPPGHEKACAELLAQARECLRTGPTDQPPGGSA